MKSITLGLLALLLVVLIIAPAQAAAPKLVGSVGPGFTINLTSGGKKATKVKAGKYTFVIADKASIHNFVLEVLLRSAREHDVRVLHRHLDHTDASDAREARPPHLPDGDDPELVSYLRIEERELEASGLN